MQTRDMYLHFTRSNVWANGNRYNFSSRVKTRLFPMLFNGRALIFTYSGTQVRIAEIERLQSLFKTSMYRGNRTTDFPTDAKKWGEPLEGNVKLAQAAGRCWGSEGVV